VSPEKKRRVELEQKLLDQKGLLWGLVFGLLASFWVTQLWELWLKNLPFDCKLLIFVITTILVIFLLFGFILPLKWLGRRIKSAKVNESFTQSLEGFPGTRRR
jgi:uncharacterized membrane protein